MNDNNQPQPPTAAERAEGEHDRVEAFADSLEALVSDIVAEAHGSCVAPFTAEYAREQAYDAIHKLQDDKEAAESALAALEAALNTERLHFDAAQRACANAREREAALEARLSDMAADRDETRDRCAEVAGRLVALEARLAEVGAVVEAVAAWQLTAEGSDEEDLAMLNVGRAYNALRAARAKHEKGGAA